MPRTLPLLKIPSEPCRSQKWKHDSFVAGSPSGLKGTTFLSSKRNSWCLRGKGVELKGHPPSPHTELCSSVRRGVSGLCPGRLAHAPLPGDKPAGPRHWGSGDQQWGPVYLSDKFRASFLTRIPRIGTFLNYFPTGISMEINALSAVMLSALIWRQVAISLYLFWELNLDPMLFLQNLYPRRRHSTSMRR